MQCESVKITLFNSSKINIVIIYEILIWNVYVIAGNKYTCDNNFKIFSKYIIMIILKTSFNDSTLLKTSITLTAIYLWDCNFHVN